MHANQQLSKKTNLAREISLQSHGSINKLQTNEKLEAQNRNELLHLLANQHLMEHELVPQQKTRNYLLAERVELRALLA